MKEYVINGKKYRMKKTSYKDWKKLMGLLKQLAIGTESTGVDVAVALFENDLVLDMCGVVLEDESGAGFSESDFPEEDIPFVLEVIADFFTSKQELMKDSMSVLSKLNQT